MSLTVTVTSELPPIDTTAIGAVPVGRLINTTLPLTGGGSLNSDLTLSINDASTTTKGIVQLVADGVSSALKVPQANDSRLSNSRTPLAHASTHFSAGSDSVRIDELKIGTDVTTLNSTINQHGLLPKLDGSAAKTLTGDGNWTSFTNVPAGIIVMWSGLLANIPTGWRLCDGGAGTPNLLNLFIRGVATNVTNPGTTGGATTTSYTPGGSVAAPTFSGNALGTHTHNLSGSTGNESAHTHSIPVLSIAYASVDAGLNGTAHAVDADLGPSTVINTTGAGSAHSHSVTGLTTDATSAGTPSGTNSSPAFSGTPANIAIVPTFYALAFIIKL